MEGFEKYAQYLRHPLVLIGFVLFLVFGVHKLLIQSGIIRPLSARGGSKILHSLLRFGFVLALTVVGLGFGLEYLKVYSANAAANGKLSADLNRNGLLPNLQAKHISEVLNLSHAADVDREALKGVTRDAENLIGKAGLKITPENLVGLGILYLQQADFEKAIASFLEAAKENPSMGPAYAGLAIATQGQGNEYLQQNNYDQAQKTLEKAEQYAKIALQYYPDDSSMTIQLGYTEKDLAQYYSSQGNEARAKESLESAARLFRMGLGANPQDAGAHNGLGDVYSLQGDLDRAIAEHETAVKLEPSYTFAWYDLAINYYEKCIREQKPDQETLRKLAGALMTVFELQTKPDVQHLPPTALEQAMKMKDFAVTEAARLKKK
jgi:tetratricopeptide (TPR) repeat protein